MQARELAWEDFPALARNYLALYDEVRENPDLGISLFAERPTWAEEGVWFAGLYRRVERGEAVAVVADEGGRAVGLCEVQRKGPSPEAWHVGVLGVLVARDHRGHGAGRAMLERAIALCRGRFELVELTVNASNPRARKLYETVGFRLWGTFPRGLRRGDRYTDVDHMVLDLR